MESSTENRVPLSRLIAPVFYPVHHAVKHHTHDEIWLKGGRGSGKSSFVSLEIILGMLGDPEANAIIYRKVADTLRDTVYAQLWWAMEALGVAADWKQGLSPLELTHRHTGQRIIFRGMDKPEKSKGLKLKKGYFKYLWVEELTEFRGMGEIRTVKASVFRGKDSANALTFYTYNPPQSAMIWVNEQALMPTKGRLIHSSDYRDLPREWLGDDFIRAAEAMRDSDPHQYKWMYLGEVVGTGGRIFKNLEVRRVKPEEWESLPWYFGHDFGFAVDPDATVKCAYSRKRRTLYLVGESIGKGLSLDELAKHMKQLAGRDIIIADNEDTRGISELRNQGVRIMAAKKGPGSVDRGLKWLQTLAKIIIDPVACPYAAKEFQAYEYDRGKDDQFIPRYPDRDNHCLVGCTIIHTTSGDVPIQALVGKTGTAYCYNEEKRTLTSSRFFDVRKTRENVPVYRVELANGKSAVATAEHPFLTAEGWKRLSDLTEMDELICIGGLGDG